LPARIDGAIAVLECADVGKVIRLKPIGQERMERFLVADCAREDGGDGTRDWMARRGILAEVDAGTAARWGATGLVRVTQLDRPSLVK
jgi:hypothetical protein